MIDLNQWPIGACHEAQLPFQKNRYNRHVSTQAHP